MKQNVKYIRFIKTFVEKQQIYLKNCLNIDIKYKTITKDNHRRLQRELFLLPFPLSVFWNLNFAVFC